MGTILDRYRFSQGWQPLPEEDHNLTVAAWLEVMQISGVPVEYFEACYSAARQTQIERRAEGESVGPLSAEDLAVEWLKIRKLHNEINNVRMLEENAPAACLRCFGTGFERMPDGSVKPGCNHVPMTPEEEQATREHQAADADFVKDQTEFMREALKKIGNPKPPAQDAPPQRQQGVKLFCTNEACARSKKPVSSLFFAEGGQCKDLLNRGDSEKELKLCDGVFVVKR